MPALPRPTEEQREARKLGARLPGLSTRAAFAEAGEFGLLGATLPDSGIGGEALARIWEGVGETCTDAGLLFAFGAHCHAVMTPLRAHGSELARERYLRDLASGARIGAHAASEAAAGSDAMAMEARAERDGDGWRLSGSKLWVTNGADADLYLVFAKAEEGVTGFLVERDTEGLRAGEPMAKAGLRGASLTSLYLEDVRVSEAMRVGEPGRGSAVFHTAMLHERALILAPQVGAMRRVLERATKHARSRKQFGRAIGKNQLVASRVVEMYRRYILARGLLGDAASQLRAGTIDAAFACLVKLQLSEWALEQHLDAVRTFGGSGYLQELGFEEGVRDALGGVLYSGTSDMQRVIIAAHLGLG